MPQYWVQLLIIIWTIFLIVSLGFGGYFMFKKFFSKLPKEHTNYEKQHKNTK